MTRSLLLSDFWLPTIRGCVAVFFFFAFVIRRRLVPLCAVDELAGRRKLRSCQRRRTKNALVRKATANVPPYVSLLYLYCSKKKREGSEENKGFRSSSSSSSAFLFCAVCSRYQNNHKRVSGEKAARPRHKYLIHAHTQTWLLWLASIIFNNRQRCYLRVP